MIYWHLLLSCVYCIASYFFMIQQEFFTVSFRNVEHLNLNYSDVIESEREKRGKKENFDAIDQALQHEDTQTCQLMCISHV